MLTLRACFDAVLTRVGRARRATVILGSFLSMSVLNAARFRTRYYLRFMFHAQRKRLTASAIHYYLAYHSTGNRTVRHGMPFLKTLRYRASFTVVQSNAVYPHLITLHRKQKTRRTTWKCRFNVKTTHKPTNVNCVHRELFVCQQRCTLSIYECEQHNF